MAAEAVLIFAAARLRALGSHEGVFEFSEIGALATYDDSLSLIITAIGTCSAILAIREGYVGLADPIPGYGEAYEQATGTIAAAGEEMADTAIDAIEEAAEDALEDAEDALDELLEAPREAEEQFLEIAGRIDAHNNAVTGAREEARKAGARKASDFGFVQGAPLPRPTGSMRRPMRRCSCPGSII
ncbi:MAG: hypothetical protein H6844_19290 [Alphaproteobacteria bacterium]|nr:hypothetical protein [Alphaproteobacteria bacterium]